MGGTDWRSEQQFLDLRQTQISRNFVGNDRFLEMRSGLSQWGALPFSSSSEVKLLGRFTDNKTSSDFHLAGLHDPASATTSSISLSYKQRNNPWQTIDSEVSFSNHSGRLDERFSDYAEILIAGDVYQDPSFTTIENTEALVLTTEGEPLIFYGNTPYAAGLGTDSNYRASVGSTTYTESGASSARYVESFDERLVFFNEIDDSNNSFPTRVRWSARGSPLNFFDGGSQDLIHMRGDGTGLVASEDRLVLFSTQDVWVATPRRDAFAFDFDMVTNEVGCPYPRTIEETDAGIIWMGPAYQLYLLQGGQVWHIGGEIKNWFSQNAGFTDADDFYATYDRNEQEYQLYVQAQSGDKRAWFLDTTSFRRDEENPAHLLGRWYLQRFDDINLYHGINARPQLTSGAQAFVPEWNTLQMSSENTPYIYRSGRTTDDGSEIDARWRSAVLSGSDDQFRYTQFQEMWLDYDISDNRSLSSVSVVWDEGDNLHSSSVILGNDDKHYVSGISRVEPGLTYIPMRTSAQRMPQFELRFFNVVRPPRLSRIRLRLRDYTGRWPE